MDKIIVEASNFDVVYQDLIKFVHDKRMSDKLTELLLHDNLTSSISPVSSFFGDAWPPFEGDTTMYNSKMKNIINGEL